MFEGFFHTPGLEDVHIKQFEVVWKGGVKSKIDACIGFHIVNRCVCVCVWSRLPEYSPSTSLVLPWYFPDTSLVLP